MAKRFRKVFIVCEDNDTFGLMSNITIYNTCDSAEWACKRAKDKAVAEAGKMWNANKPLPVHKVHGFYLVHEDMFRD